MSGEQAPGVYFEESNQRVTITAANATLAGFMGLAARGSTTEAELVTSWADYTEKYGGFHPTRTDLGLHLFEFFNNGGSRARVLRLLGSSATGASNTAGILRKDAGGAAFAAYAANEGDWGNALTISTLRHEVQANGTPSASDLQADPKELPNTSDNDQSLNACVLSIPSLVNMAIGDIYDVFNPSTGARVTQGPITLIGFDSTNSGAYFRAPTDFIANCPANPILRTNSMHLARTVATTQLAASPNATEIDVLSTENLSVGSLVSLSLFSHCESLVTRSVAQLTQGIVSRVNGNKVTFVASAANSVVIPAATTAFLRWVISGTDGIDFTARATGPGGNTVSVSMRAAQASNSVEVIGRHIRVNLASVNPYTNTEAVAAIAAHASANALVSAAVYGSDVNCAALAQTMLTGGASLTLTSQEFGISVQENGVAVETTGGRFDYLSTIITSKNYFATRLGGTTSPLTATGKRPSRRIILIGGDGDLDTAAQELAQLPMAIRSLALTGGADGDDLTDGQLVGARNPRTGMYLWDGYTDVDFACAPGYTSPTFMRAADAYTQARGDMEWLFDMPVDLITHDDMLTFRQVDLGIDSTYSQLFAPWGKVTDLRPGAERGALIVVPPTPMVAGLIARAINAGGAHYSCGNQQPTTWVAALANVTDTEHGSLNRNGVCIVKSQLGRGIRLSGDRTLAQNGDSRKFGNVRRWLNYIKQSISVSLSPLQFRPANTDLFDDVESAVDSFLEAEWKKGALVPRNSKRAAYYVKCDQETTTAADLEAGDVVGDIGVSPVTPTERIRFRLSVSAGGISLSEAA